MRRKKQEKRRETERQKGYSFLLDLRRGENKERRRTCRQGGEDVARLEERREESVTDGLGKLNTTSMFETLRLGYEYYTVVDFPVNNVYSQEKSVWNR